jgi:hypothetical protein
MITQEIEQMGKRIKAARGILECLLEVEIDNDRNKEMLWSSLELRWREAYEYRESSRIAGSRTMVIKLLLR